MLDRRALMRVRSGLTSDDRHSAPVELRWVIEQSGDDILARAAIVDSCEREAPSASGVRVTPLLESRGGMMRPEPVWIDDGDMVHVDLPGLVIVSLRRQRDGTRLLYARTRLLEETLGLPGGRYEPVSVSEL